VSFGPRYETIAEIGSGGMASVWVGRVVGAGDQLVALKRAHPHVKTDERAAEAMMREAELAARVRHPNVVGVHAVDEVGGDLVIVLDYVEGATLRLLWQRLEEQRVVRPREMIRILLDIAAGLDAAHRAGLIHRDVSPSNILVGSDGVARLSDFGIAKAQFSDGEQTKTGILKGKLAYMAPEYLMYQRIDALSDMFSFGVIGWEALTGHRLFKGDSDLETLAKIADADVRAISSERPELRAFDGIFLRALAKQPEDRFASLDELAGELEVLARGYDLIASHAEVAALVEHLAGPELSERRRLLRSDVETMYGSNHIPQAEPSGDLPTQIHTGRASGPPQQMAPQQIMLVPAPRAPTVRIRTRKNERAEVEARREKLALVGALMLLALALGWMWTQLNKENPPVHIPPVFDAGSSPAMPMPMPAPTQRGNRPRR
jgi:hypothetical protein